MKYPALLFLSLVACGPDSYTRQQSGYICSCEQREELNEFVRSAQTNGVSDDSERYLDHLFSMGVKTICEHRDSVVLPNGYRTFPIGLQPCELWVPEMDVRH